MAKGNVMQEYVLYGTGLEGERFLYQHNQLQKNIVYCIDASHAGSFHGIPIVTIENAENLSEYKIIIAAVWKTYCEIKEELDKRGLKEFENYIWASVFDKKLVLINANCHGNAVLRYLENSITFRENYAVYPVPLIHMNIEKRIEDNLLKNVDVYIHQDIRKNNQIGYEVSDDYIIPRLKTQCKTICIPNFVGMAHWMFPRLGGGRKVNKYFEWGGSSSL